MTSSSSSSSSRSQPHRTTETAVVQLDLLGIGNTSNTLESLHQQFNNVPFAGSSPSSVVRWSSLLESAHLQVFVPQVANNGIISDSNVVLTRHPLLAAGKARAQQRLQLCEDQLRAIVGEQRSSGETPPLKRPRRDTPQTLLLPVSIDSQVRFRPVVRSFLTDLLNLYPGNVYKGGRGGGAKQPQGLTDDLVEAARFASLVGLQLRQLDGRATRPFQLNRPAVSVESVSSSLDKVVLCVTDDAAAVSRSCEFSLGLSIAGAGVGNQQSLAVAIHSHNCPAFVLDAFLRELEHHRKFCPISASVDSHTVAYASIVAATSSSFTSWKLGQAMRWATLPEIASASELAMVTGRPLWDILSSLDECIVIDPPVERRQVSTHRVIKIRERVSAEIRLDPDPEQIPEVNFIGPSNEVASMKVSWNQGIRTHQWRQEYSVVENLESILGIEIPRKVERRHDTHSSTQADDLKCAICSEFASEDGPAGPEIICESCGGRFHAHCLRAWLITIPETTRTFTTLSGYCVLCPTEIEVPL